MRHTAGLLCCPVCHANLPAELAINVALGNGAVEYVEMRAQLRREMQEMTIASTPLSAGAVPSFSANTTTTTCVAIG